MFSSPSPLDPRFHQLDEGAGRGRDGRAWYGVVLVTVEAPAGLLLAALVLGERLAPAQLAGAALVVGAIVILQVRLRLPWARTETVRALPPLG